MPTQLTLQDQVIYGALTTLAREMGHRLKRAAHSSLIRESDDYGAAIISANYELLAEAETTLRFCNLRLRSNVVKLSKSSYAGVQTYGLQEASIVAPGK